MFDFSPGDCITFRYSTSGTDPRRLEILEVRSLHERPLQAITVALCPQRQRGSVLISGLDLDKLELRHFYLEKMSDIQAIERPSYVLAAFDPSQPDLPPAPVPAACLGPNPTFTDLVVLMRRGNAHAVNDPESHRLLGLFAPDAVPKLRTDVRCA